MYNPFREVKRMEEIKNCYKFIIENIPQFQEFIEQHKHLTTDELAQKYNIQINKEQDI